MKLPSTLLAAVFGPVAGVTAAALLRYVEAGIYVLVFGIHQDDRNVVIPAYGEIALFAGICWLYIVPLAALLQRSRLSSAVLSFAIAFPLVAFGLWYSDLGRLQAQGVLLQGTASALVAILVPVVTAIYVSLRLYRRSQTSAGNETDSKE